VSFSGRDENPEDPLLCAINEFRQELIRWIDSQLSLLRQREAQTEAPSPDLAASAGLAARLGSRPESDASGPGKSAAQDPHPGQGETPSRSDARDRLDALARQLSERLRLSEGGRKGTDKEGANNPEVDRRGPAR
jgi:hypothetical protein